MCLLQAYEYGYKVEDSYTGDKKEVHETRDSYGNVKGSYSVSRDFVDILAITYARC